MRLILRAVPALHAALEAELGLTSTLPEQWIDEVLRSASSCSVSAFLSLPDAEQLSRAELLAALEEVLSSSGIALSCPLPCCWLLVQRPASSSPSPSALFALEDSSDVQCLVKADELLLLSDASLRDEGAAARPPPSPLLLDLAARFRALPPLRVTRRTKPLSERARILRDFDRAQPCLTPRIDTAEPVWEAEQVRAHAAAAAGTEESRQYALLFRRTLSSNGFVRLRLPPELQRRVQELQSAQLAFFRLPGEVKQSFALPRARGLAANYQPPFGYVVNSDCNKEYLVVRQPPVSSGADHSGGGAARAPFAQHPDSTQAPPPVDDRRLQYTLPAGVDMEARVWPVFHALGYLCQDMLRLLLSSLDVAADKIDAVLHDTLAPARDSLSLGHTSVMELFCYRSASAQPRSAAETEAGCLPCSIHTDASLLTLIPRSVGPAGLEIFNWRAGDWQAVEAQARGPAECVVFAGDMLQRLVNGAVLAAQHRVVFDQAAGADRLSSPFELFAAPDYLLDCAALLSDSWQHFAEPRELSRDCRRVEAARTASGAFSAGLVSVNKSDAH